MLQNRERTGVPARAARVGWWMRPDQRLNVAVFGSVFLSPAEAGSEFLGT